MVVGLARSSHPTRQDEHNGVNYKDPVNWRNAMKRSSSRRNRGFTLVEVLLVLVILVILASLVTVNVLASKRNADLKAAKVQVELLDHFLQLYLLDIGSYPSQQSGLQALRTVPADLQGSDKWGGPYIERDIPMDPWGKPFTYTFPGTHNQGNKPDVYTVTPDNVVIGNWSEEVKS